MILPSKVPLKKLKKNTSTNDTPSTAPNAPVALDGELDAGELHGEVACHEGYGHEEDGDFGEEQRNASQALDAVGFFDGDEVEVLLLC
jgi:hypothetical protein